MNKGVEGLMTGSMRRSVLIKQWNSSPLLKKNGFSHRERERLESYGSTILQSVMSEAP